MQQLINRICESIIKKDDKAKDYYHQLKIEMPDEGGRVNLIVEIVNRDFYENYILILSKISALDEAHFNV